MYKLTYICISCQFSPQGHLIVVLLPETLRDKLFASIPTASLSTSAVWFVIFITIKSQSSVENTKYCLYLLLPQGWWKTRSRVLFGTKEVPMFPPMLLRTSPLIARSTHSTAFRFGKCHGYDGYIRVKKLASWGKKFGRPK